MAPATKPHVVIVGAGFGGLACAKRLGGAPIQVTIIDRRNYHLFVPLLYQVATAALSPADIAQPIRRMVSRYRNINVVLGDVRGVDVGRARGAARRPQRSASTAWSSLPARPTAISATTIGRRRRRGRRTSRTRGASGRASCSPSRRRRSRPTRRSRRSCSPRSSSAAARPGSRWRARSPSSPAIRSAATSAASTRRGRASFWSRQARGCCRPLRRALSDYAKRALEKLGVTVLTGEAVTDIKPGEVTIGGAGREGRLHHLGRRGACLAGGGLARRRRRPERPRLGRPRHGGARPRRQST